MDPGTDENVIELLPLTQMMERMFSPEFVQFVKEQYGSLRKFYERSTTETQCNNTAGEIKRGETKCWICDYTIPPTLSPEDAFSPECEHVFPIAQAVFFIGLYTNEIKGNDAFKEKLKLEYSWSHRVCNQIKNDAHFIVHNNLQPDGRWYIDIAKIKEFLLDILQRGDKYGYPMPNGKKDGAIKLLAEIEKEGITPQQWVAQQSQSIYNRCNSILQTIPKKDENFWILATVSDLVESYETSGFRPPPIPPYNPIAVPGDVGGYDRREVTKVYTQLSLRIMSSIKQYMIAYLGERLRRYTPQEKAFRAQKALYMYDDSLISAGSELARVLHENWLPNNVNKQARFLDGVQYILYSMLKNRIKRLFTTDIVQNSPILHNLNNQIDTRLNDLKTILIGHNLSGVIQEIDSVVNTYLIGAGRRSRC